MCVCTLNIYYSFLEEMSTTAHQMLQKHLDTLSKVQFPMQIFHILYMERVISKQTFDEANKSGDVVIEDCFCALCDVVSEDHNKIKVVGSVLLKFEQTVLIAKDILKEYGKYWINLETIIYGFTLNFICKNLLLSIL